MARPPWCGHLGMSAIFRVRPSLLETQFVADSRIALSCKFSVSLLCNMGWVFLPPLSLSCLKLLAKLDFFAAIYIRIRLYYLWKLKCLLGLKIEIGGKTLTTFFCTITWMNSRCRNFTIESLVSAAIKFCMCTGSIPCFVTNALGGCAGGLQSSCEQ